ncbi:T9SS type A sorting domain-containing protein [Arundinibacter roseus]|uniref:T9SS type A sorting domain-containing protein n=1 Tax=Arundinibacter roseus TaxID=2070510 RepID=A0A4R4JVE7_9BACT|nr:T9SS type A sorting domain-containing protein [Arundinibacter roseus]
MKLLTESGIGENGGLNIFPNPTTGKAVLNYKSSSVESPAIMHLSNANGRLLYQETLLPSSNGQLETTLDLSSHPSGLYIVSIQHGSFIITKKIIRH